jgi:prepilin-type N-terminal cleavage/methylation domain-containing protein
MTNVEARRNDKIRIIKKCCRRPELRRSGLVINSAFNASPARTIRYSSFRGQRGVTIIELLVVIIIILILAGLVLSISSYVQNKGARARAETEIAAISAALESYKADNGIYPRDGPPNNFTDTLDARINLVPAPLPSPNAYTNASFYLYSQLSGLDQNQQPVAGMKSYFTFKSQMLGHPAGNTTTVTYIRDPFGNSYGYSTANQANPSNGYNPTFDLWSTGPTASPTPTPPTAWIKNW